MCFAWQLVTLLRAILDDRLAGRPPQEIAAAFHAALASGVVRQLSLLSSQYNVRTVALSGGVFQNELLLKSICNDAEYSHGLRVLINELLPAGDGGIAVGQAALAARLEAAATHP